MKLTFVIQKLAARSGGAERVLIETANEMAERGHAVEIISYENRGAKPFYRISPLVKHTNLFKRPIEHKDKKNWKQREAIREGLPLVFPLNRLRWRMTHGGFVKALRAYIKAKQPDILIPFLPPAITPCVLAARRTNVKVIASTHNAPPQDYENKDRWDPNPIDVALRQKVLKEIDEILVLLPEYKEWYPASIQPRVTDMPNPVPQVSPDLLESVQREKLILGVGRLAEVKRFHLFVSAWNQLADEFPEWRVEIYGEGPEKNKLQELINNYGLEEVFELKGTSSEMPTQYLRASFLCHPAEYEGFPLAVSEALAHGLPVVGFSDCTGVNALVASGVNGVLVPPGTNRAASLANALRSLINDPERLENQSRHAVASVAQYAPHLVYDRWEEVIRGTSYDKEPNY